MSSPFYNEKYRRPSIAFTEGLKKAAGGVYRERGEYVPWMFRAIVIAIDTEGGKLETPNGEPEGGSKRKESVRDSNGNVVAEYEITPTTGPRNPKNSIRARITTNNMDQFVDDDNLRTFWPLFPSGPDNPSPGEVVYVVFEDENMSHGLWLGKVPSNLPDESKNQILMSDMLKEAATSNKRLFPDTAEYGKTSEANPVPTSRKNRLTSLFINQGG